MSEPILEPVSPISESGDHPLRDWTPPRPRAVEEIHPAGQRYSPSFIDFQKVSSDLTSLSETLKSSAPPTERLLAPLQYEGGPLSIYDQLGRWNLIVIGMGSIYALIILGCLWFLWGGQEELPFWKWLVLENYVQRTVTLLSAILRVIVAAQSSLATSMLASIIMETLGFTLNRSAFLSLSRVNAGMPFQLLEVRYFLRHAKALTCLIVLLSFTTIAAYLASTALIADFEVVSVPGYPVDSQVPYSLSDTSVFGDEPMYSNYRPANFPIFAEYSEPADRSDNDVDDTGPTLRAILPIASATVRQNLNSYSGHGTLLNSHVVCVKPVIQNLTFESTVEPSLNSGYKPLISGTISLSKVPAGIMYEKGFIDFFKQMPSAETGRGVNQSVTFICQMTQSSRIVGDEWPISMCVAGNRLFYNNTFLDWGRLNMLGTRATSLLSTGILMDPLSYVMVNYTGIPPKPHENITTVRIDSNQWTETKNEWPSWTTFQARSDFTNFKSVSISYCFTHFAAIDAPIFANSSTPNTEPTMSKSNSSFSLDARNVTRQLGADGVLRSLCERGILSLQKSDTWAQYNCNPVGTATLSETTTTALDGTYGFGMVKNSFTPPVETKRDIGVYLTEYESSAVTASWGLCTNYMVGATDGETFGVHLALAGIFQAAVRGEGGVRGSGSVARGLQALFTVVSMMQYYDRQPQFDLKSTASISLFEQAIQPRQRGGITFLTLVLIIHILTIIAITVIFHKKTTRSFVGQHWHAVAQLQTEKTVPVLEKAGVMRDREVERWMNAEGIDGGERFFMFREVVDVNDED